MEIALIIIGLTLGFVVGVLYTKSKNSALDISDNPLVINLQNGILKLEESLNSTQSEKENALLELQTAQSSVAHLQEKLDKQKEDIEASKKQMQIEFENLANKILDNKSEKFAKQNRESLDQILSPLKENIKAFEEKVDKAYNTEGKERFALKKELESLLELNHRLSKDANDLTQALKGDSQMQGSWGEYRLEMILEKVGLKNGTHFDTQGAFRDDDGSLKKPDFIIHLPENKHLIIDSKVSLTAYEQFCSSEDAIEREQYLKAHINSIRSHIQGLAGKQYQQLYDINTPDYVLMYIPIEPAFNIAAQNDEQLITDALDKNIVLVTTSTLMATMKTVSYIWKQEDQRSNVKEIAQRGAALYDKFKNFTDNLLKLGKQMDTAKTSYEDAMKQLSTGRGSLVRQAEIMKDLGLETPKQVNQSLVDRALNSDD